MTKGLCGCRCAASADLASSRGTSRYIRTFLHRLYPAQHVLSRDGSGPGRGVSHDH
jgi:hypothetical protein